MTILKPFRMLSQAAFVYFQFEDKKHLQTQQIVNTDAYCFERSPLYNRFFEFLVSSRNSPPHKRLLRFGPHSFPFVYVV